MAQGSKLTLIWNQYKTTRAAISKYDNDETYQKKLKETQGKKVNKTKFLRFYDQDFNQNNLEFWSNT